jgi:hypothetical protein
MSAFGEFCKWVLTKNSPHLPHPSARKMGLIGWTLCRDLRGEHRCRLTSRSRGGHSRSHRHSHRHSPNWSRASSRMNSRACSSYYSHSHNHSHSYSRCSRSRSYTQSYSQSYSHSRNWSRNWSCSYSHSHTRTRHSRHSHRCNNRRRRPIHMSRSTGLARSRRHTQGSPAGLPSVVQSVSYVLLPGLASRRCRQLCQSKEYGVSGQCLLVGHVSFAIAMPKGQGCLSPPAGRASDSTCPYGRGPRPEAIIAVTSVGTRVRIS